jgi:sulfide:quinone oxidoreductase
VRGIALGEHGFIAVDRFGAVAGCEHVYAAGDATDFPIKHGGLAAQHADVLAQTIAALAGAAVTPDQSDPTLQGMLLTGASPLYLSAQITGGRPSHSQFSDTPLWSPPVKIAARYLAPYLDGADREPSASAA